MQLTVTFANRSDAGKKLAKAMQSYIHAENTLILALVRGGVVIGAELRDALHLPLFPYIVRKLGHPDHREYALGAIAEGGATYLDEAAMKIDGTTWQDLEPVIDEETDELQRRQQTYMVDARPPLKGKIILLTDDGAATGATLFAAIEDLHKAEVSKIVVGLPVCPPDTAVKLAEAADKTVFLATPSPFHAVGLWYNEFDPVEDEEVLKVLDN